MYRLQQARCGSEKGLRMLRGPRPGRREGQTSQEVHRRWLSVSACRPIPCPTLLIMRTPRAAPVTLHRERGKEAGFSTLLCLNNDVGIMNRATCYSLQSFGSRPAASLVKAPVSNDPCQRMARAAVMTYHTSSPHTDNQNLSSKCCCRIRPPSGHRDGWRETGGAGECVRAPRAGMTDDWR